MDEPVYPRYTAYDANGDRVLYRVSHRELSRELWGGDTRIDHTTENARPPRFRVKIDRHRSRFPFVLYDASRPVYRGRFETFALAMRAIDNKVREERGREHFEDVAR